MRNGTLDTWRELALHHASRTFAVLHPEDTVAQALASIGAPPIDSSIVCFYVVDEYRRLYGVVPTRQLMTASPQVRVSALMTRAVVTLPLTATMRDVAATLRDYHLSAVPLVGALGRIHAVIEATACGRLGMHSLDAGDDRLWRRCLSWFCTIVERRP